MTVARRTGRIVGALLLVLLATGLVTPYVLLRPLTTAPAGFLDAAAGMAPLVRASVLMLIVGGAVPLGISIAAWPFARARAAGLGRWLVALALANFVLQIVENSHWLTLLSVSQACAESGAAGADGFRVAGILARAAWKWAHYSHIAVVVGWLFTLFLAVFRTALAPRPVGMLGMSLCVLHSIGITFPVFAGFRMPMPALFGAPLALGILALAAWLLARGFPHHESAQPDAPGRA